MTIDEVTGATIGVEVLLELPAERVWAGITAIERYGEWSPECTYGAWLDEPLLVGSRFEARNEFPDGTKTQVVCVVTQVEPVRRFGWDVYGGEDVPLAHWQYVLEPRGSHTLVRQRFTHGPGDSGMRRGAHTAPQAIHHRLSDLATNMRHTLTAMTHSLQATGGHT